MASLEPGTVLGSGRYRVNHEINRGGTAVVYEGVDLTNGRTVALKVMAIKDGKSQVPVKGVKREIEYAASMHHDNIVQLLDYFVDETMAHIILVWELISGPDLLDLLNECGGRLDEPTAAFYFRQLLQGVMFIHDQGLCHRDLKPENCMVDRATRQLKIIDFGLSKHQQSAVTLGVGTPDYMAPELLGGGALAALSERRVGTYDPKACDVWAMGVLVFLLISGQYPFEDPAKPQNVVATLQNIMAGRMRPLPRATSPACGDLVRAMLTRDPAERITLQGISQHPWVVDCGRPAPCVPPATPPSRAPAPAPRSPPAAAALAGVGDAPRATHQLADAAATQPAGAAGAKQGSPGGSPTGVEALAHTSELSEEEAMDVEPAQQAAALPRPPLQPPAPPPPQPAAQAASPAASAFAAGPPAPPRREEGTPVAAEGSFCFQSASSGKLPHQDTPTVISLYAAAATPTGGSFSAKSVRAPAVQERCSRDGPRAAVPTRASEACQARRRSEAAGTPAAEQPKRPRMGFCRFLFGGSRDDLLSD